MTKKVTPQVFLSLPGFWQVCPSNPKKENAGSLGMFLERAYETETGR